jgi:predicted RNase H-like HicB family nuclease
MAMNVTYRVLFRKEPEGGFTAIVPSLPGCVSFGKTLEEAKAMVREAIELYLESLKAHGEAVPTEDDVFEYTLTLNAYA